MSDLRIQISHRSIRDGKPSITTIELDQHTLSQSALQAAKEDDAVELVPADASEMAQALAAVSGELGCQNTLEDMLHAIDAIRNAPGAQGLQWSGTLCNNKRVDHATAERACTALGEGWRLPTRQELDSILDLTRHEPAIDTERFPGTESGAYWSSTPCAWSSDHAWVVSFYGGGSLDCRHVSGNAFVRAVRSVPAGQ